MYIRICYISIYRQSIAVNVTLTDKNYVKNTVDTSIHERQDDNILQIFLQVLSFVDPRLSYFRDHTFTYVD